MTKDVTQSELLRFVNTVQKNLLTSNSIVDRTQYPYFHSHSSIPQSLINFKKRLRTYRMLSSDLIEKEQPLFISGITEDLKSFTKGTFAHTFTGSLVVSSFGIGECAECSSKLAVALIQAGYSDLAFVSITFPNAKTGMEISHQFIITNLPTMPKPNKESLSVYELFQILPKNACIGDAFLGLSFKPKQIPTEFIKYIDAFGKETRVVQFMHLYNWRNKALEPYLVRALQIEKTLKSKQPLLPEDAYALKTKEKIKDTTLILLLKEKTGLPFFGVCDEKIKVDAVVEIKFNNDKIKATNTQQSLKGHGRFFELDNKETIFVLEGINIPDENPLLIKNIQSL